MRIAGKLAADDFNRLGLCEGSLDLVLLLHPLRIDKASEKVQLYFWVLGRPSHVHIRSDQSSWKRLCRMPKVVSSVRAVTASCPSTTTPGWSQTNRRYFATR